MDLTGKYFIPALIKAHRLVALAKDAMDTGPSAATTNNVIAQLRPTTSRPGK